LKQVDMRQHQIQKSQIDRHHHPLSNIITPQAVQYSMMFSQRLTLLLSSLLIATVVGSPGQPKPSTFKINFPGRRYDDSDEDVTPGPAVKGSGRDFDLFDTRPKFEEGMNDPFTKYTSSSRQRAYKAYTPRRTNVDGPSLFQTVQEWWSVNLPNFPKLIFRVEPTTTLKISKTFRPLGTIVKVGADFNTNLGVWQFKSSWEDAIIGGKLTLAGKELQLTKSWQLSMGKFKSRWCVLTFLDSTLNPAVCTQTTQVP
jgi:hypothetical protein